MKAIYHTLIKRFVNPVVNKETNRDGKIIIRYNIPDAKLEYYFIHAENILEYEAAHLKQDLNAHKKLGTQIVG